MHLSGRRFLRRGAIALALAIVCGGAAYSLAPADPIAPPLLTGPTPIEVEARPIAAFDLRDRARTRFGELEYRGGVVLTSPFKGFGGLSALRLDPAGERFLALSDKGFWFTGRLTYKGRELSGLAGVEVAPMRGPDGRPLAARGWYDTESIARSGDTVYVGIERVNQIVRFDFGKGGVNAPGQPIPVPPALRKLPYNGGIEAMILAPKTSKLAGALIALSERGHDSAGNHLAFILNGPSQGQFTVVRSDKYDISGATLMPNGEILLLERKFSLLGGAGIRIRRIPLSAVAAGAVVDGPVIFEADFGYEIDNFEGIDTHRTPEGETVVTLISDNNFSMLQRTLLLQFTLTAP